MTTPRKLTPDEIRLLRTQALELLEQAEASHVAAVAEYLAVAASAQLDALGVKVEAASSRLHVARSRMHTLAFDPDNAVDFGTSA